MIPTTGAVMTPAQFFDLTTQDCCVVARMHGFRHSHFWPISVDKSRRFRTRRSRGHDGRLRKHIARGIPALEWRVESHT